MEGSNISFKMNEHKKIQRKKWVTIHFGAIINYRSLIWKKNIFITLLCTLKPFRMIVA